LRPGSITKEQLDKVALEQGFQPFVYASGKERGENNAAPLSPGTKYRHYAPNATVLLASSLEEASLLAMTNSPALILARPEYADGATIDELSEQSLYGALRKADSEGFHTVILVCDSEVQNNIALMNRISKAASGQ